MPFTFSPYGEKNLNMESFMQTNRQAARPFQAYLFPEGSIGLHYLWLYEELFAPEIYSKFIEEAA